VSQSLWAVAAIRAPLAGPAARAADSFMVEPLQEPRADAGAAPEAAGLSEHVLQNIESVVQLQRREWSATAPSQRHLETLCRVIGRPAYLVLVVALIAAWIGFNSLAPRVGGVAFDPPPFAWLEGLLTAIALLTSTVILIAQNYQTKLERQRAHLDLQVNLLTEQKVTKLIHLLEELRRDLPMVRDRHDAQANAMQQRADAAGVVSAIEDVGLADRSPKTQP
jgi:uncharacterized membrane protein